MSNLTPQRFIELGRLYGDAVGHVRTWAAEGTSAVDAPPGLLAAKELVYEVPLLVAEIERLTAERDKFKQEAKENDGYLSAANATVRKRDETIAALRAELGEAKRQGAESEQWRQRLTRQVRDLQLKLNVAERKVHAVRMVKLWKNEDGKWFVFADDLWAITDPESQLPSQAVVSEAVAHAVNVGTQLAEIEMRVAADKAVLEAADVWRDAVRQAGTVYRLEGPAGELLAAIDARNGLLATLPGSGNLGRSGQESTANGPEQTDDTTDKITVSERWACGCWIDYAAQKEFMCDQHKRHCLYETGCSNITEYGTVFCDRHQASSVSAQAEAGR